MIKKARLGLALVAIGLAASLIPRATFTVASSGEPVNELLQAWPGWGVQQDLGPLSGPVGRVQIWVSAEPGGADVRVLAALVAGPASVPVRQTALEVPPGLLPIPRTLAFATYFPDSSEDLRLQLQVSSTESNYVEFGVSPPHPYLNTPSLNGDPDAASGPIAYELLRNGSGLRAAAAGEGSARVRLVIAVAIGALALAANPRVSIRAQRITGRAIELARRVGRRRATWARRFRAAEPEPGMAGAGSANRAGLPLPWYPWLIVAFPVLHFLASNPLQFRPIEAVVPLIAALIVATLLVLGFRLVLKDWHRPAALTALSAAIFFAYGHVANAMEAWADDRVLFPVAVVLGAVAAWAVIRCAITPARTTRYFNVTAAVLLAFPLVGLAFETAASVGQSPRPPSEVVEELATDLLPDEVPRAETRRPDIYFVIFDEYGRQDALGEFDNAPFLGELEDRGFYIASQATSNYMFSSQSIASTVNMSYPDDLGRRTASSMRELVSVGQTHTLGAILKQLGYTYVHLASGFPITDEAPLADVVVTFTRSGVRSTGAGAHQNADNSPGPSLVGRFAREFIQTTALRPLLSADFSPDANVPFPWWHPDRAKQTFEFLSMPIAVDGPKFVFAQVLKPHKPANFDQYGNVAATDIHDGFTDEHDPSVPDAYIGQLIYINSMILTMVDGIIGNADVDPIIVLTSDHGRRGDYPVHAILAAYHLPEGGDRALYSSISAVNQFRVILDYYFGLGLGLLEDASFVHDQFSLEFQGSPPR